MKVYIITKHVDFEPPTLGVYLHSGHHGQAAPFAFGQSPGDAGHSIMVGDADGRKAHGGRRPDYFNRRLRAIRSRGVIMQIGPSGKGAARYIQDSSSLHAPEGSLAHHPLDHAQVVFPENLLHVFLAVSPLEEAGGDPPILSHVL